MDENHTLRKLQPKSMWYLSILGTLATTQREYVALHAFRRLNVQVVHSTSSCFFGLGLNAGFSVLLPLVYYALFKTEHLLLSYSQSYICLLDISRLIFCYTVCTAGGDFCKISCSPMAVGRRNL